MTTTAAEPITITVRPMNVPAKKLPVGLWIDVLTVLRAHGLDPSPTEVTSALSRIVRHTPVEQGGRLLADGRVDTSDYPDLAPSWFCKECHVDSYSDEAKADHDRWCRIPDCAREAVDQPA